MSSVAMRYFLWLACPAMQLVILAMMRRRKLQKDFPFFQTYTIFQVLSVAINFSIYHWAKDYYFYSYWVLSALGIFLGFAVLHEVFGFAIRPYVGLRDLAMLLFRWASLVLVVISTLLAVGAAGTGWD